MKTAKVMTWQEIKKTKVILYFLGFLLFLYSTNAFAVPSFERQTGLSCTVCHTVFPQLTPFGRSFKQDGYTFSKASNSEVTRLPLAAMVQASFTSLNENGGALKSGIAPFDDSEDSTVDKFNLPQQASVFYGGRIIHNLGAFSQVTYDGTGNDVALDNTDIRYARTVMLRDKHLVYGFTVNNSPTVEDLWNTTPAWGFPFGSSDVAPGPAAATLVDGTLAQQVGGIGAYVSWANLIYGSFCVYRTTNDGIARPLGAGTDPDTITDGAVPYWRIALTHQLNRHSMELGAYGLEADVFPEGTDSGSTDTFKDYAFDSQYQYISDPNIFTIRATWIHEKQEWDASYPMGNTENDSDTLKTLKINSSYTRRCSHGTLCGSLGYFSVTGDTDTLLYAPEPLDGSRTGSPKTKGFIMSADYVIKEKYKFTLQYTIYDKFNGSHSNYDGFGRDASDNDTLYLLAWLMF